MLSNYWVEVFRKVNMPQVKTFTQVLSEKIADYTPGQFAKGIMGRVGLVGVIGPTGTGKTSIIREAVKQEPGFFREVVSRTTRYRRPGEENGIDMVFDDSPSKLSKLYDSVDNGWLVQVARHETTGDYYWPEPLDYMIGAHSLMAILAPEYEKIADPNREVRFASTTPVMVACNIRDWNERVIKRFGSLDARAVQPRVVEGWNSLSWGIEQGDAVTWIDASGSDEDSLKKSGRALIDIATKTGEYSGNQQAAVVGNLLFAHLQILGGSDIKL